MFSVLCVCHSVCSQGVPVWDPGPCPHLYIGPQPRPRHVLTCSTRTSLYNDLPSPDMLKLVHCKAWTVSKRVVGIRLKCLLLYLIFAKLPEYPYNFTQVDTNYPVFDFVELSCDVQCRRLVQCICCKTRFCSSGK